MSNLQELYVAGNKLTGTMPRHSAQLTDTPSGTIFTKRWVPLEVATTVSLCLLVGYIIGCAVMRRLARGEIRNNVMSMGFPQESAVETEERFEGRHRWESLS